VPAGCQVVFRAADERVLARSAGERRAFAGVMLRVGKPHGLFAVGVADTHGHAVLTTNTPGRFVHDARLALAAALEVELAPARLSVVRDSWHAENLIAYVHGQDQKHGADLDPFREGTSLHPLLGLRPDGVWIAERVRGTVPRVRREDLLAQLGVAELGEARDLPRLADAAAAAVGVASLVGRQTEVVRGRLAAVHAMPDAATIDLARALGVTTRAIRQCRQEAPDPTLVRAVRLQLGLRAAVASRARVDFLGVHDAHGRPPRPVVAAAR
jgi:hypothetical protein